MPIRNIRDLIEDLPVSSEPEPTLTSVARSSVTERTLLPDEHPGISARMPGDDPHPLGAGIENPIPSLSVLELSRALREGAIPFETERKVRAYLSQYQRQSGESVYDPRFHNAISTDQRKLRVYGDDTVLPTSIGATQYAADVEDDGFNVEDIEF
jgi:hypothetical protein